MATVDITHQNTSRVAEKQSACLIAYAQAFSAAVNESLEQWFIMGDGLQYVSITGHITDGPLAQSGAAESEDVTV